ncbi:MAG: glycine cleavage system protein H [Chloroflexota bacterium]
MSEFLEATVDKFTFKVATDRLYSDDHLWLKMEEGLVSIGLTDYLQQTAGDVAFAEPEAEGTNLATGDILGSIETMKTTLDVPSPLAGVIRTVNPRLEDEPELVNQDPYGAGWLVQVEVNDWEVVQKKLFDPQSYYERMKAEAEEEAKKV